MRNTKKAKAKRGRPRLPRAAVRATPLLVRLRPDELTAYQEAAKAAGLSLSAWVRARCEAGLQGP